MRTVVLLAAGAAFFLCACSSSRGSREKILLFFDTPSYLPALSGKTPKPCPFKIQVRRFKIDPLYDNQKVVLRHTDFSVTFSRNGEWAVRPQVTASDLLTEYLKANFASKPLRETGAEDVPDLIITGDMRAVEEDHRTGERAAALALILKVIRAKNDEVLLEASFRKSRPCGEDGYAALAREFSLGLSEIYRDFVQRLDPILSRLADESREENKG